MALYDNPAQIKMVRAMLESAYNDDFETEEEREEAIQTCLDTLEAIEFDSEEKVKYICQEMKNTAADIEAFKAEEARLAKRRKAMENANEHWKAYLKNFMESMNYDKYSAGTFKLSFRNTKSVALDVNPEDLPIEYQRVKIEADKQMLKKLIEAGEADGIAHLEEKRSLSIR